MTTPPTSIAHFRIVSKLGEGGMGAVYRGTDTKLNRDVAIKVLPDSFAADPGRLARFAREAQVLASLNHPNIAAIYGVEERALVMELVAGEPLRGPLPLETVLDYARQIADVLEYAHDKGIVHRDLKPANVMVTGDGVIKVLDFGLAKAMSSDAPTGDPGNSPTLTMGATEVGTIMGTAGYMAPEQARGKVVDRRADIWAFGVVVWELLTGKPMFAGENATAVLAEVLTKEPDLSLVPAQVRRLLESCLQKEPKRRLKSIGDWRLLVEDSVPAAAPGRASRLPWVVAGVLALGLAGALWMGRGSRTAPEAYHLSVIPPDGATLLLDSRSATHAVSPDGRSLAFIAETDQVRHIWVRPLDSATARQFAGTELAEGVFWSPDSRRLGFMSGTRIKILDIATAAIKEVCEVPNIFRGAAWNSSGTILVGIAVGGILSVSADGGKPVAVTAPDRRNTINHQFPQFLPDGKRFLYWSRGATAESTGIFAGTLDTAPEQQNRRLILPAPLPVIYAGGQLLYQRGTTLFSQRFNETSLSMAGMPVPVTELSSPRESVSVSRNGILTISAMAMYRKVLSMVSRDGKRLEEFGEPDANSSIRLSPDGRTAALTRTNLETASNDIWLLDLARRVPVRITNNPSNNLFPVWSPDGREILFSSTRNGGFQIYRKPITGELPEQTFGSAGKTQYSYDWSKDGKAILLTEMQPDGRTKGIWQPLAPGSPPVALSSAQLSRGGRFSPSGRWVAFTTNETGETEVYVQEVPGTSSDRAAKVRVSRAGGANPAWSADGGELYFNTPDNRLMAVPVKSAGGRFEAGEPKLLFALGGSAGFLGAIFWEPMPDGKRFLVLRSAPVTAAENRINVMINWQEGLRAGR